MSDTVPQSHIRNFSIIAHIDHGKSTLADRLLLMTKTIETREFLHDQLLDNMDLEQERGITIKSHPVTMRYTHTNGETYQLNLIDTPGHVDFTYEVSRSLAACEGAILVVDAVQGVEAQTVANTFLAADRGLTIIPVLNKIDLPGADIEGTIRQIEDILSIAVEERILISAKTGLGVESVLDAIIRLVPAPRPSAPKTVRALVFDSVYDEYKGVMPYVRIMDGSIRPGDRVKMLGTGTETQVKEVGKFMPKAMPVSELLCGEVGYIVGTIRQPSDVLVGDTVTLTEDASLVEALPGFKEPRPMVFSGLYPVSTDEYEKFRASIEKLSLNDSSFTWHPESSVALGFGFRCGFLGLLHMEIIQERMRREFGVDIISTTPSVIFKVYNTDGSCIEVDNPTRLPDQSAIDHIEEPMIKAIVIMLNEQVGDVMRLVMERRGIVEKTESLDGRRLILTCLMPLLEILTEFHDSLKSVTRGYGSMDYEHAGYQTSEIVKMDILLNSEPIDAFSCMVHVDKAEGRGRRICETLKDVIPSHMFSLPVQAAIGKRIIARETIKAFRKDVTAKLYGGDITRKRKVLEKQKEGKRRMKQFGTVNVPQEAFVAVLKTI